MSKISGIHAIEILDSRGNPTVCATVVADNGMTGMAMVPSGASKGTHEAVELRDHDKTRYRGSGVLKSLASIHDVITPRLIGMDPIQQKEVDSLMITLDGTETKEKLGANSILAISLANARLAANILKIPLYKHLEFLFAAKTNKEWPVPMFNVINGGLHGGNNLTVQEFMLIPSFIRSFDNRIRLGAEIYQALKKTIKDEGLSVAVGDEGGFTPAIESDEKAIELLETAIGYSGYAYVTDVTIGLDMAASTYFKDGYYRLAGFDHPLTSSEYMKIVSDLKSKYHLYSLEDAFAEDEWESWIELTRVLGSETMIVGDDLLVTNPVRLQTAIEKKACNAILVKVNQIGSLTETLDVIRIARKANFQVIISHRSGETSDDFIADLSIGTGADFVKFGAPARGERVAKYNRLLQIYSEVSENK